MLAVVDVWGDKGCVVGQGMCGGGSSRVGQ